MQAIIYPNDQGGIAVIIPAPDCGIPLFEIGRKDVPAGVAFRIIPTSAIPQDRTYREAWTADFSAPDGVGLGQNRWWIEQFMAEIAQLEAQEESEERTAAIAVLQAKIETMKAEVLKIEGVQL